VQRKLGLDRLAIARLEQHRSRHWHRGETSNAATIEAGRYVSRRSTWRQAEHQRHHAGAGADRPDQEPEAAVRARHRGTVQGATPQNDPGSTIGLATSSNTDARRPLFS